MLGFKTQRFSIKALPILKACYLRYNRNMKSIVIIPTYNEMENIESMLTTVMSLPVDFHVLIVDDNSPDGTAHAVKNAQTHYPERISLLSRDKKEGLGKAYISGFQWALNEGYDFIFEMDCDFSHPPEKLVDLHHALSSQICDIAIGSRYKNGIRVKNWPIHRIALSIGASIYVRLLTLLPITDPTAGFIGYSKSALEKIAFEKISFQGYGFQIAIKFWLWKAGLTLKEIPITFYEREKGASKMSSSIISEAIIGVIKLPILSLFKSREMIKKC